jgi:hypothetical protein
MTDPTTRSKFGRTPKPTGSLRADHPLRRAPAASTRAAGTAILVIGVLLLVGGTSLAAPTSVPMGAAPTHSAAVHGSASHLLAEARASAARGGGPGAVPSAAPDARIAAGPNVSFGVVMTFDVADNYVLAVSLNASAGPLNNTYGPTELTWRFAAGNWSLLPTTGHVPATFTPGLVYDGHDGYVLLYGGRLMDTGASFAPVTNQTWSYKAGVWANLSGNGSTPAPTAVTFANPVYDALDEYVVLYDELGIGPSPNGTLQTTWTYAAGVWTNRTATAGTPPVFLGQMAYDAVDQYVLYFGGDTFTAQLTNATWTFHNGLWANISGNVTGAPTNRINFGITYDSLHQEVLLYGGFDKLNVFNASAYSNETWAYAAGAWTLLSANGSSYAPQSMVYDPADNETVLLGSSNLSVAPPNVVTWTFSAGTWTVAAPAFASASRYTDVGVAITLAVTTSPNGGGLVYRYSGLPLGCTSQDLPTLRCVPTMAGTYPVAVTVTGAAGFLAVARTTLHVAPHPAILGFSPSVSVGEVGVTLGFAVTATPGTGALTYSYLGLPAGCTSADTAQLQCLPSSAGTFDVTANVSDTVGGSVTSLTQLTVVPTLMVVAFTASHSTIDVGQTLSVAATLGGGVGPFAFAYGGLPNGCATADQGTLACQPSATGSFVIGVSAGDQLGRTSAGTTTVLVNALPTVSSVAASNSTIAPGGSVEVATTISGGTAPFQYRYAGLPTGCAGTASGTVTCSGVPVGQYAVSVKIVDATGASATGTTSFRAVGGAPGHTGGALAGFDGWLGTAGFWSGLAIGAVAIAIAGIVGAYRLRLTRQGEDIVRGLRAPDDGSPASTEAGSIPDSAEGPEDL